MDSQFAEKMAVFMFARALMVLGAIGAGLFGAGLAVGWWIWR